jgi:hypothetical protein
MPDDIAGSTVPKLFCFGSSGTFDPETSARLFSPPFRKTKEFSRSRVVLHYGTPPPEAARASYHARARLQFIGGGQ